MEFLKLQFGIYDFLSILLPGIVLMCEVSIGLSGWKGFAERAKELNPAFSQSLPPHFSENHGRVCQTSRVCSESTRQPSSQGNEETD